MTQKPGEIIIPREKAVFRMDGQGYWRNAAGRFRNKKIIDHFHRSMSKDENGFFVCQDKGGVFEKVYFPFEETALFVFDVIFGDQTDLVLNTGETRRLIPEQLFTRNDNLYVKTPEDLIKFSERALIKISKRLEDSETGLAIRINGRLCPVPPHQP